MTYNDVPVIVDQFEEAFRLLTLVDIEGGSRVVPVAGLQRCPHFANLESSPGRLERCKAATVDVLAAYMRNREWHKPIDDLRDALLLARHIDSRAFACFCANTLTHFEINDKSLQLFAMTLEYIPLRTYDNYQKCLPMRDIYNEGQYDNLVEEFNSVVSAELQRIKSVGAHNIPVELPIPLFMNRVTVALIEDIARHRSTAVLIDDKWVPVDIFGGKFSPSKEGVKNFYLCFDQYVIYLNYYGAVMKKEFGLDQPAEMLFAECKFFKSCNNELFVIVPGKEEGAHSATEVRDTLYMWDHDRNKFIEKLSNPLFKMRGVNKACDGSLILVADNGYSMRLSDEGFLFRIDSCTDKAACSQCRRCSMQGSNEDASMIRTDDWRQVDLAHIGYNTLEIKAKEHFQHFYETVVYTNLGTHYTLTKTTVHGAVDSITDVLIQYRPKPSQKCSEY